MKLQTLKPRLATLQSGVAQGAPRSARTTTEKGLGWDWQKLREQILIRDDGLCQPCERGGKMTSADDVDHIVPRADGGTNDPANLQSICRTCHKAKTAADEARRASYAGLHGAIAQLTPEAGPAPDRGA